MAIFSLAYFGQQSWSTLIMVLPADIFPLQVVGAVAGLVGFGGAIGGIAFGQAAGYLLDHGYGYQMVFALVGTFHILALITILIFIPNIRPIKMDQIPCYEGAI
jgi:MFS transporter, ACS family, hexuronate transporter